MRNLTDTTDAFAQLDGKIDCRTGTITSIALYEIEWESGAARYRFIAAVALKDFEDFYGAST